MGIGINRDYVGKQELHLSLTIDLLKKIDIFANDFHFATRKAAIVHLIKVGIPTTYNLGKLQNPEIVDTMSIEYEEGRIVDWVSGMNNKQLQTLFSILKTELDDRTTKTLKWRKNNNPSSSSAATGDISK